MSSTPAQPTYIVEKLEADAFDGRLIDRHIAEARISRADLAEYLSSLPDSAKEGQEIHVALGEIGRRAPQRTTETYED